MRTFNRIMRSAMPLALLLLAACGGNGASAPAAVTTSSYSAGGAVSGLIGTVVLQDNGGDNLSLTANGNFTFATKILNGNTYKVTVLTQPAGLTCSVSTGTGTVSGSNVTNVAVVCSRNSYTVGGNVSGLTGSVVLQDNNGDNLSVTANGAITFATPVAFGSPYSVTVLTQPANMSCSVANGTGTIAATNVSNVAITCAFNTYTVGGTVTGLNGSVVLQDNGADNSTVSVNGPFNFPTAVAYGNPYSVSILTQPTRQLCSVSAGAGTVAGNISNVGVNCLSQLGGSIQGAALNLSKTVSTFAGTASKFLDGTGAAARFNAPQASVSDGVNLYVADKSNNAIRKIVIATGVVTTFAGSPTGVAGVADGTGTAATFTGPSGITTDGSFLYEVENGPCMLRKIEIATRIVTTMIPMGTCSGADGIGLAASFMNPMDVTTDGTNLYVVDSATQSVRKVVIATNTVSTLAGAAAGVRTSGATDGTGTAALFNTPVGITIDTAHANLYVVDKGNQKIRQIVIATGVVSSLTGTANAMMGYGAADGAGTAATFGLPAGASIAAGITADGSNLYVADRGNNKIRQIVIATGVVSSLTGTAGTASAAGNVNGALASATFSGPGGVRYDTATNSLFVADTGNNDMRQITLGASSTVSTLAGIMGPDGTGAAATFNAPYDTTTDGTNLYVADNRNNTIRQIVIATGVVTTLAGSPTGLTGAADGIGTAATFAYPSGITTDGTNLYVADNGNTNIRQIVIATGAVTTLAGQAGAFGAADGTGTAATFNRPSGITTDGTNLYVTETFNQKIRQIVIATGVVSSLTGTANTAMASGAADGAGTAATFNRPFGITTDGTNLYVADTFNNKIRQIVIATGVVSSLTGTANTSMGFGALDGAGTAATFSAPKGITTDGSSLYVTDTTNNTIRKIQ